MKTSKKGKEKEKPSLERFELAFLRCKNRAMNIARGHLLHLLSRGWVGSMLSRTACTLPPMLPAV